MASSLAKAPTMSPQQPAPTKQVQIWRCDVCQVASFQDYDEACRHENECRQQKEAAEQAKLHPFFQQSKKRKTAATTDSNAAVTKPTAKASVNKKNSKSKESNIRKTTKKAKKDSSKTYAESSKQTIELTDSPGKNVQAFAAMFARDEKSFLAEQRVAELQAKRRMQQQRQKEQQPRPAIAASKASVPSPSTKKSHRVPLSVRFPSPSHILPSDGSETKIPEPNYQWLTKGMLVQAQAALQMPTHPERQKEQVMPIDEEDNDDKEQSFLPSPESCFAQDAIETADSFQEALSSILIPPTKPPADTTKLWSDKYSIQNIPDDICGTSLSTAAKQMQDFVQQWMAERHKANERAAEKQRALRRAKKKKKKAKKTSYKDDVDDLWADSDDEESRLPSLFLLTGPVGCGKTSIVHAVARECGCEVLEINTSEKRGAAAIRRALEEATQSHSSLDMLKKREASFFGGKELVDSDEESEGKGSSVTVILIDEADNLYEQHGDNGFWAALSDLTKRAKCPIFLTANVVPHGIFASSFRFEHVEIELPKPVECLPKIQQILKEEGFSFRTSGESHTNEKLELIAELCDCDLRRIGQELQLFASANQTSNVDVQPEMDPSSELVQDTVDVADSRPSITSIRPRSVPPCDYSLLSIEGSKVLQLAVPPGLGSGGYPVDVFVGDQKCPQARIMDDSTIVAVCSPFVLPPNIDAHGNYRGTHRRSLAANYVPVKISGSNKTGVLSTTQGMVSPTELPDGTRFAAVTAVRNIECHFPSAPGKMGYYFAKATKGSDESGVDDDKSDEEFELKDDGRPPTVVSEDSQTSKQTREENWKLVAQLLKEGIDAWHSTHGEGVPSLANDAEPDQFTLEQVEGLSSETSLLSDAAFFEELVSAGMPYISGACRGFGFDLTEEYPKSTNEKSKPPSEERLFKLGWKDDCSFFGSSESYVSIPSALLGRRLLKRTESDVRGLSLSSVEDFEPPEDDEDHKGLSFDKCEEDMFLSSPTQTCVLSLPTFLRQARKTSDSPSAQKLGERRMLAHWEKTMQLAADYVFPSTCNQMFSRGLSRVLDNVLPNRELVDSALFLDYLPLVRCIALHERAAEHIFVQAHAEDPEFAATLSNRQRSTRRSRKLGRKHYLEKISPAFQWQQAENHASAKQIGAILAESALVY